jgi:hypothetical protein
MKVSFMPAIERPTDASLKNMKTAEIRPSTAIVILSMPAGEQRRCRTKGLSTETRNNGRTARELLQAWWTGNLFSLDRLFHRRGGIIPARGNALGLAVKKTVIALKGRAIFS